MLTTRSIDSPPTERAVTATTHRHLRRAALSSAARRKLPERSTIVTPTVVLTLRLGNFRFIIRDLKAVRRHRVPLLLFKAADEAIEEP